MKTLEELKNECKKRGFTSTKVREDNQYYYIDLNAGLGESIYPKKDFTIEEVLKDLFEIID